MNAANILPLLVERAYFHWAFKLNITDFHDALIPEHWGDYLSDRSTEISISPPGNSDMHWAALKSTTVSQVVVHILTGYKGNWLTTEKWKPIVQPKEREALMVDKIGDEREALEF